MTRAGGLSAILPESDTQATCADQSRNMPQKMPDNKVVVAISLLGSKQTRHGGGGSAKTTIHDVLCRELYTN